MDSDTIWTHIDAQRAAFASILEALDESQWAAQSLCGEWTVREVAAHVTLAQVRFHEIFPDAVRAGFRPNVMIRDSARRRAVSEPDLVGALRRMLGSRRRAPFVSEKEPMIDILVHTQDVCVPLGIEHEPPVDAVAVAIERTLDLNNGPFRLRAPLRDVRLVATDADFAHGDGREVRGTMRWLLMAAAGREVAHQHLSGEVAALT